MSRSARSSSATMASTEPVWTAFWLRDAEPPRPAAAGPGRAATRPTTATARKCEVRMMRVMVVSVGGWWSVAGEVLARVVLSAVVGHEDEQVVLVRGQLL